MELDEDVVTRGGVYLARYFIGDSACAVAESRPVEVQTEAVVWDKGRQERSLRSEDRTRGS